ncbi:unnamed protein product, partial [Laminaria digitata]
MYKNFAKTSAEAWRQRGSSDQARPGAGAGAAGTGLISPKFAGMHAARCYLGALSMYEGSGWRAAEQYAYTVLPTELRALQRPVAALQLYVRLVVAGGQGIATATATAAAAAAAAAEARVGGGLVHSHHQQQQQPQQQQQEQERKKRALREAGLMSAFRELCWRYPDAARVAARAWERGRESSKLDMSFFPITPRARGP